MLVIGDWIIQDQVPAIIEIRYNTYSFRGRNISNSLWIIEETAKILTLESFSRFLALNRYYKHDKKLLKEATMWLLERHCGLK